MLKRRKAKEKKGLKKIANGNLKSKDAAIA